jgi:nucleoside 2-deoxyribosyltransferase
VVAAVGDRFVAAVYVASPLGFSAVTRRWYDESLLPALRGLGLDVLDPWADPDGSVVGRLAEAAAVELDAGRRAALARMIATSDAVFAILDGVDVDSGTAAEIGYAAALGKPVVGLRLDQRTTGDNDGALVNLQVEHFLRMSGGGLRTSLDGAIALLTELVGDRA